MYQVFLYTNNPTPLNLASTTVVLDPVSYNLLLLYVIHVKQLVAAKKVFRCIGSQMEDVLIVHQPNPVFFCHIYPCFGVCSSF